MALLFYSPEKIIPSSGDNIDKGNTFVHLTDPLPQSNSFNNYWPTDSDWIWLLLLLFCLKYIISKSNYDLSQIWINNLLISCSNSYNIYQDIYGPKGKI